MPKEGDGLTVEQIDSLLSFYLHIKDPTALTENEWAKAWNRLEFALSFDGQRYSDVSVSNNLSK